MLRLIIMGKLTPDQRSYCMSRIRSKWTKQEIEVHNYLKGHKIRHEMHPKIPGSPDIILKDKKTAIFLIAYEPLKECPCLRALRC